MHGAYHLKKHTPFVVASVVCCHLEKRKKKQEIVIGLIKKLFWRQTKGQHMVTCVVSLSKRLTNVPDKCTTKICAVHFFLCECLLHNPTLQPETLYANRKINKNTHSDILVCTCICVGTTSSQHLPTHPHTNTHLSHRHTSRR